MATEKRTASARFYNRLLDQRIAILEKEQKAEESLGKASHARMEVLRGDIDTLKRTQSEANKYINKGVELWQKYAEALQFAALAHKAFNVASESSKSQTARWLYSAQSLDKNTTSYKKLAREARSYQEIVKEDIRIASRYGMQVAEVQRVTDEWLKTMRFVGEYSADNRKQIQNLTEVAIRYGKVLGVDGTGLVKKASHRMFQYGESAEVAMDRLIGMDAAARAVNKTLGDLNGEAGSYLWADDFTQIVEEAARSTRGWSQDLETLTAAMAYSVEQANRAGQSYNATLEAGKAMGKFITGGGQENGVTVNLGMRLLDQMKRARTQDGGLSEDFLQGMTDTQRADMERIAGMIGTTNDRELSLYLADAMATTKRGMGELYDLMRELGSATGDIVPLLMQHRGLTRSEAIEMARQLRTIESRAEFEEAIAKQVEAQARETANVRENVEGMEHVMRALAGKDTGIPVLNEGLEWLDEQIGGVRAHFNDFHNLLVYMGVAGALGVRKLFKAFGGGVPMLRTVLGATRGIAAATRDAAVAAAQYKAAAPGGVVASAAGGGLAGMGAQSVATGMRQALLPYSGGGALRVMDVMGGMGGARGKGGYYHSSGGGPGKKSYTPAERKAIAKEVAQRRKVELGASGGKRMAHPVAGQSVVPQKGGAGRLGRLGGVGGLAAYMAADYLLSSSPDGDPDSMMEKAKGWGMTGLNGAMIWSMLGMPGKGALGAGAAKVGGLFTGAAGTAKGAATAVAGTGAAAAGATAAGVAGTFAALPMLMAYSSRPDNKLKRLSTSVQAPMEERWLGTSYNEYLRYLADNPEKARDLLKGGVITEEMFSHAELLAEKDSTRAEAWSVSAAGASAARAAQARSTANMAAGKGSTSLRVSGTDGEAKMIDIDPDGKVTFTVPLTFEAAGMLGIPAMYDKLKKQFGS